MEKIYNNLDLSEIKKSDLSNQLSTAYPSEFIEIIALHNGVVLLKNNKKEILPSELKIEISESFTPAIWDEANILLEISSLRLTMAKKVKIQEAQELYDINNVLLLKTSTKYALFDRTQLLALLDTIIVNNIDNDSTFTFFMHDVDETKPPVTYDIDMADVLTLCKTIGQEKTQRRACLEAHKKAISSITTSQELESYDFTAALDLASITGKAFNDKITIDISTLVAQ